MQNDFILVLDFGGAQAMAMARKLRGQNVYCEIHSGAIAVESIRKTPVLPGAGCISGNFMRKNRHTSATPNTLARINTNA